jgi:hypothetical protein
MKIRPFVFVALLGVAAIVTSGSAVVLERVDQRMTTWRSEVHALGARVDAGKIVTRVVRGLVQAAKS